MGEEFTPQGNKNPLLSRGYVHLTPAQQAASMPPVTVVNTATGLDYKSELWARLRQSRNQLLV